VTLVCRFYKLYACYVIAVIADQRASGGSSRAADDLARRITGRTSLTLPAAVTAGDEFELVCESAALPDVVALLAADAAEWYVGIGLGTVEATPGAPVNLAAGSALVAAREAVGRAKADPAGLVVVDGRDPRDADGARALRGATAALSDLISRRAPGQHDAVALWREGQTQRDIAERLGVTQQAVSHRLRASGVGIEDDLRLAVSRLAEPCDGESGR
jgi:hypothetical protein